MNSATNQEPEEISSEEEPTQKRSKRNKSTSTALSENFDKFLGLVGKQRKRTAKKEKKKQDQQPYDNSQQQDEQYFNFDPYMQQNEYQQYDNQQYDEPQNQQYESGNLIR